MRCSKLVPHSGFFPSRLLRLWIWLSSSLHMKFVLPTFITSPTDRAELSNAFSSAWASFIVLESKAVSSVKSASVRWTARQCLPLCQWIMIPKIITFGHCDSHHIVLDDDDRYGVNVSPCRTQATIGKKFVLPSLVTTWATVSIYRPLMASTNWDGNP